jgi:DNA-binding response OmpR family regulator
MKSSPNILVVDDDADLLVMMHIMLSRNNMNVSCINDGSELFRSIDKIHPDVILMDINLGNKDGRQLCHQLKMEDQYNDIPVILFSAGQVSNESIQYSLASEFISKPFDMKYLVQQLNSFAKCA